MTPGHRGTCILVRQNLVYNILDLSAYNEASVEMQGIEIFAKNEKYTIINIYRHPNCDTPMQFFEDLLSYIVIKGNCIIMGDLNAHHKHWGCHSTDRVGKRILEACEDSRSCILGDHKPTLLLPPSSGPSVIDLIIATPSIAPLCNTHTEDDTWGSDHFPISVTLGINPTIRRRYIYKIKLNPRELLNFSSSMDKSYASFANNLPQNPCEAYSSLIKHIVDTALSCSSTTKKSKASSTLIRSDRAAPPWWSNKCQEAIEARRAAAREWRSNPTILNFLTFKRERSKCSKTLYKEKRKSWREFVGTFNAKTPSSKLWSLVKAFKRRNLSMSRENMELFKERQLTSEAIQKLCPPSCLHNITTSLSDMKKEDEQSENILNELDTPITTEHLDMAISLANNNSAPGLDRISNNMLDYLPSEYREILVDLFNSFLQEGVIPTEWRSSLVIFIPKAGAFENIMPSAVLDKMKDAGVPATIRKFIENLIVERSVQFLEQDNLGEKRTSYKGTPQGSVLSPLLFNIALCKIGSYSRSVLQAISSHRLINGNYIIHKIKQTLLQLEHNNIDCSLFWIPSHKGILGNELADKAAKEACVDGARGFFRTPYSDLQVQAVAKARVRFTDYLNDKAIHTGAHYHSLYFSSTTVKPWYFKKKLTRSEIVLINRLRDTIPRDLENRDASFKGMD
ncbi:PREDICTED: RNA-directed DNA polymerase from mobile element jockey-like [Cyphomyrmex costatus]|uniref:RNA-directed DNA polymerase from mobile element jockey-like n=1 Tax=Cyphomyrmex costatus TaxID=456900 RepID=UPI0008522F0C|nr:PREDICTED: RNA-directed DNA polymerase from mobile element jockey-like [Cyphomyrmex costatus]